MRKWIWMFSLLALLVLLALVGWGAWEYYQPTHMLPEELE